MTIARLEASFAEDAAGAQWPRLSVIGEDGTVGSGEGSVGIEAEAWVAAVRAVEGSIVGQDARRVGWLVGRTVSATSAAAVVGGALDVALHDLVGRALGVPAYDLIGGRYRDRVRVAVTLPAVEVRARPDAALAAASKARASGATALALPLRLGTAARHDRDGVRAAAELVRAVRDAIDDGVRLAVEVEEAGNAGAVIRLGRAIEDIGVAWLAVGGATADVLASLGRRARVRVATSDTVDRRALLPILRAHAADLVAVSGPGLGLADGRRAADLASHYDAMVRLADGVGRLGLLANVQLAAAHPAVEMVSIEAAAWSRLGDAFDPPLVIEAGAIVVPEGPGLGTSAR